jgi:Ca-activated chloride channel family protein
MLDNTKQDPAAWVIIFLTDGQGTYTPAGSGGPASVAASKGYVIYSIGLTIGCNSPLVDMANATGGKCYSSPSPANLQAIFDEIFEEIVTSTIPYDVDVT